MRKRKVFQRTATLVLVCFAWLLIWPGMSLAREAPVQNTQGYLAGLFGKGKTPKISPETEKIAVLSRLLNETLYRLDELIRQVKAGKREAVSKMQQKTRALKGLLAAMEVHIGRMQVNLEGMLRKKNISRGKVEAVRKQIALVSERFDAIATDAEKISPLKSDPENQVVASQIESEIKAIIQEQEAQSRNLPDLRTFKPSHRNGKEEVEPQDPPQSEELLKDGLLPESDDEEQTEGEDQGVRGRKLPKPEPPGPADLAQTVDVQITPEIVAKATELGKDPVKMFKFVHDKIFFEPYWGSQKGSLKTLLSNAGNAFDQASLLIALLRASGIPARYETGTVQIRLPKLLNWVGVTDPATAIEVLRMNGIPARAVLDDTGEIEGALFQHVWVLTFVEGHYFRLDPSFKQYDVVPPIDPVAITGFNNDTAQSIAAQNLVIDASLPTFTGGNKAGLSQYVNQLATKLEPTLQANMNPYGMRTPVPIKPRLTRRPKLKVRDFVASFSEIPDALRHKVSFSLSQFFGGSPGPEVTFPLPSLTDKRIAIASIPATPEDAAILQEAGGIFNVVPAFAVQMRFVLKVEDEVVQQSTFSVPLGLLIGYTVKFTSPNFADDVLNNGINSGATLVFTIVNGKATFDPILRARVQALRAQRQAGPLTTPSQFEEAFWLTAMMYNVLAAEKTEAAARFSDVTWNLMPTEAIAGQIIVPVSAFGLFPYQIKPDCFVFSDERDVRVPFSRKGVESDVKAWLISTGAIHSSLEGLINENVHGVISVSTVKVLDEALARKIPVHVIIPGVNLETQVQNLDFHLHPGIKDIVTGLVNQGYMVIIPHQEFIINEWLGIGFMAINPTTGDSHFLVGGTTVLNGGQTTSASSEVLAEAGLGPGITSQAGDGDGLNSGGGVSFLEPIRPEDKAVWRQGAADAFIGSGVLFSAAIPLPLYAQYLRSQPVPYIPAILRVEAVPGILIAASVGLFIGGAIDLELANLDP